MALVKKGILFTVILYCTYFTAAGNDNLVKIDTVKIAGIKVTKPLVIYNEIDFREGDEFIQKELSKKIEISHNNLVNTSLFNFINILPAYNSDSTRVEMNILVTERWYIWPMIILEHADRNLSAFLKNKDWSKINYGLQLNWNNFRGRNESLSMRARFGYKEQFAFSYLKPYINNSRKNGLYFEYSYFRQKEIAYRTFNDNQDFYKSNNGFVQTSTYGELAYIYRTHLYERNYFAVTHSSVNVSDTITKLNPEYLSGKNNLDAFGVYYRYVWDNRDQKYYPLTGRYVGLETGQNGLGLFKNSYSEFYVSGDIKVFKPITKRLNYGLELFGRKSFSKGVPYYVNLGLGYYEDYINSFENNVVDGADIAYAKNILKFNLVPTTVTQLDFIPLKQFSKIHYALYGKIFLDFGYVKSNFNYMPGNLMPNNLLVGYGFGFDLVTYYDKVLSLNLSRNNFGNLGLYLHVNLPVK